HAFTAGRTEANNTAPTALNNEIARATAAEGAITTNLNNEVSRAQGAEATLQINIGTETAARQAADTAEANTRALADMALGTAIGMETSRATDAEIGREHDRTPVALASPKPSSASTSTANNTFT